MMQTAVTGCKKWRQVKEQTGARKPVLCSQCSQEGQTHTHIRSKQGELKHTKNTEETLKHSLLFKLAAETQFKL